jgi:hypothetical protein
LALYNAYGFGIIELKKSSLTMDSFEQLDDYFSTRDQILKEHKDKFLHKEEEIQWIGILVGTGIEDDLRKKIEEGVLIDNKIPVAGIVLNRFRSEGQIYIVSDIYFSRKKNKDYTKYKFNNKEYGKNRLVLAVVTDYIAQNNNYSREQLLKIFPKDIQGSYGVIEEFAKAKEIYDRTNIKRHFVDNPITLQNGEKIAVCNEWGKDNIGNFIKKAKELGYKIS